MKKLIVGFLVLVLPLAMLLCSCEKSNSTKKDYETKQTNINLGENWYNSEYKVFSAGNAITYDVDTSPVFFARTLDGFKTCCQSYNEEFLNSNESMKKILDPIKNLYDGHFFVDNDLFIIPIFGASDNVEIRSVYYYNNSLYINIYSDSQLYNKIAKQEDNLSWLKTKILTLAIDKQRLEGQKIPDTIFCSFCNNLTDSNIQQIKEASKSPYHNSSDEELDAFQKIQTVMKSYKYGGNTLPSIKGDINTAIISNYDEATKYIDNLQLDKKKDDGDLEYRKELASDFLTKYSTEFFNDHSIMICNNDHTFLTDFNRDGNQLNMFLSSCDDCSSRDALYEIKKDTLKGVENINYIVTSGNSYQYKKDSELSSYDDKSPLPPYFLFKLKEKITEIYEN